MHCNSKKMKLQEKKIVKALLTVYFSQAFYFAGFLAFSFLCVYQH